MDVSPFNQTPMAPTVDYNLVPLVVISALTTLFVAAGLVGFRRRDLQTG